MVTVAGPWLPFYDNGHGHCGRFMVTVVVSWFLRSDHLYCGPITVFCGRTLVIRTMVTVAGPWLLWSDHGYGGRSMVNVFGPQCIQIVWESVLKVTPY